MSRQIASFSTALHAQLARSRLEAAGIESLVTNEIGSTIIGGGVGLQVAEADVERARELLASPPPPENGPTGEATRPACVMCRSEDLEHADWPLLLRALRSLLLMAVPLPAEWFAGKRLRCRNCGYEQAGA